MDAQFLRPPAEPVGPELVSGPLIRPAALPDAGRGSGWLLPAQAELPRLLGLELCAVLCRPPEPEPVHPVPARHHHQGQRHREPGQRHRARHLQVPASPVTGEFGYSA